MPYVRSKLQGWRDTPHTPLVLDLAFEAAGAAAAGWAYRVSRARRGSVSCSSTSTHGF